jgi:hypothetical protein
MVSRLADDTEWCVGENFKGDGCGVFEGTHPASVLRKNSGDPRVPRMFR